MILDSGERRQFYDADGNPMAVRDIQEGKGRCDLLPLDVVGLIFRTQRIAIADRLFDHLELFEQTGRISHLTDAVDDFLCTGVGIGADVQTMILEVSKHFEEGCKKYGENNWQKGIPTHCYIDSAVRHFLKWLRGDTDEPHDRAFVWNILCCIWTCIHKPELNDYAKEGTTNA